MKSLLSRPAVEVAILAAVCGWVIAARWLKLESLDQVDPPMWLFQMARYADGEWPYRDFSWNYPPLSLVIMGQAARWFGPTFEVMAVGINLLSLAVVAASYAVSRQLLPAGARLVAPLAMIGICATAQTKFNLFSFSTYSPSLHFSALGLLMMWTAGLDLLQTGRRRPAVICGLLAGCFLALTTKPEAAVAALGSLVLLWWLAPQPWSKRDSLLLLAAAVLPAALFYAWWAQAVGGRLLLLGVTGYGLASFACPWWPTGLGAFGGFAALGQGFLTIALLAWPFRAAARQHWGNPAYRFFMGLIPFALAVVAAYQWQLNSALLSSSESWTRKLNGLLPGLVWTSPMLLPIMWGSLLYSGYLAIQHWRRAPLDPGGRVLLFSLAAPAIISIRGLFGTTLFPYTEVSALCYPFFVLLWVVLLDRIFAPLTLGRPAWRFTVTAAWVLAYAMLRVTVTYPTLFSDHRFQTLATEAGRIRLADQGVSAEIYRYLLAHTQPHDLVADLPYGGGFNFASRRPGPLFTTQFQQLRMPAELQQWDYDRVLARPPKVIIVEAPAPHFNTFYGHRGFMSCPAPRLVWRPDQPSWDAGHVFPVVQLINERYRVDRQIGSHLLLVPAAGNSATP